MVANKKMPTKKSVPYGMITGCALSVVLTLMGAFGIAIMLGKEVIYGASVDYAVMAVTAIAAFCGSLLAVRMAGKGILLAAMGTGIMYMAILLCCNALFFDGQYNGVGTRMAAAAIGCGCVLIIKLKKKSGNQTYRKYRIR